MAKTKEKLTPRELSNSSERIRRSVQIAAITFLVLENIAIILLRERKDFAIFITFFAGFAFAVMAAQSFSILVSVKIFIFMLAYMMYMLLMYFLMELNDYFKTGQFNWFEFGSQATEPGCYMFEPNALRQDPDFAKYRRTSDRREKKKLYRKLAMKYHPDNCIRNGCVNECTESFQEISHIENR